MKTIKIAESKYTESLKHLTTELNEIIDKNIINSMVTNGNIASILQDSLFYSLNSQKSSRDENDKSLPFFQLGIFYNLPLIVDQLQKWNDNKIYLKKEDEIIEIIEIEDENDILL